MMGEGFGAIRSLLSIMIEPTHSRGKESHHKRQTGRIGVFRVGLLSFLAYVVLATVWSPSASAASRHTSAEPSSDLARQEPASRLEAQPGAYRIQSGDTLWELAIRLNTSVERLARSNKIADPDLIYAGDVLYYESKAAPEAASEKGEAEEGEEAHPDEPDDAARLRFLQDANENGNIPRNGLVNADEQAEKLSTEAMPGTPRADLSPTANIDRNLWTWRGPGNVGGRIRSIAIHPTNPQIMWVGSVGGGIWKTTDGGASWHPLDDFMANLAVSTLVIDPANPNVLYAGTGEGFYNSDSIRGAGIFKTTDGGATWNQLSSTATSDFYTVNRLAIAPGSAGTLLAATGTGMFRSTNGGTNWTKVLSPGGKISDVNFDPTDASKAIASGYNCRIYYSTNGGASWTPASGMPSSADGYDGGRVEVAYAPSNPAIVYLVLDNLGGQIYKSTDGGQSYNLVNNDANNWLGNQGWYDNALWIDPTNANTLIVGGVDLWRSTNGGATLTKISQWQSAPQGLSAHADHHVIVSSPGYNGSTNKTVYFGNDGGIYKAQDVSTVSQTSGWQELNNNLGITQFYSGAGNTSSGVRVGGTQDNGSLTDTAGTEGWRAMFGGDGGFSAADPTDPNYFYGEYVRLQIHRSTNGGTSSSYIDNGIADAGSNALFIAPFILDPNNPNTMLAGGRSLWRSTNVKASSPSWTSIKGPVGTGSADYISAIAVVPGNSNVIWVGYANGNVYKTTNGTSATPTWTQMDLGTPFLPNRYVTRITVDPLDANTVYATFGGFSPDNVWRTTDGGSMWTDITGSGTTGLPDAPVRTLVVHPNNSNWLYVGTEVGIFASEDGGSTWSVPTDGPASVSVDELFWMGTRLVAATHGRGMFEAETASSDTTNPSATLTAPPDGAVVSGATVTLSANASDNLGVSKVEFLADGQVVGTDSSAPYSTSWNSTTKSDRFVNITARAYDAAGNTGISPARNVAVNNTTPDTTITSGPANGSSTADTTASFDFSSSEHDSSFRCSLDGAAFTTCASPKTYTALAEGQHTFQVKAVGSGGETSDSDLSPATRTWNCDDTPPKVRSTAPVNGATGIRRAANVKATFSEAMKASTINGTTFKLRRSGTTKTIAATVTYDASIKRATLNPSANLAAGATYIVTVTTGAKDLAGNSLDQSSTQTGNQPKTWKVKTAQ